MPIGGENIPMVKNNFNESVKKALKILGITQTELSERTKLSVSYISNLLNGKKRWNEENVKKVCNALGIETTYEIKGVSESANSGSDCTTNGA